MSPHAAACPQCGTLSGDQIRCPHCHALSGCVADDEGRYFCRICGGPRVPTHDLRVDRSEQEAANLKVAKRHLGRRLRWWGLSAVAAVSALGIGVLGGLLWWAALPGAFVSLLASGALSAAAVLAWLRGSRARFLAAAQVEQAWLQVAEDAVQTFQQVNVEQLASLLGTDVQRADALLNQLIGLDRVASRVTSDGRIVYSTPRVRVETDTLVRARVEASEPDNLQELEEFEELELATEAKRRRV